MGFDYAANETQFEEQDFQARYKPTGCAGLVTQDAYDLAYGYADPYAVDDVQRLEPGADRRRPQADRRAVVRAGRAADGRP